MRRLALLLICVLSSSALLSQTENFWTKKSDFGGAKRERCVGFSINNVGYYGMGTDTNEMTHNDWWAYDAINDIWMQRASLPASVRRNAVGAAIGNLGYVGLGIDSNEAGPGVPLKDFWEYNPTTNSWLQKADFPGSGGNGLYFACAFVLDYKFYVVGGKAGSFFLSDEVWEYKPFNNVWLQRSDFPGGGRYQMSAFVARDKAYVGLGADQNTYRSEFWEFDGGTGVWTAKADFDGGDRGQATAFTLGERGFICLGTDGGLKSDLWEYNTYQNTWTARASYGGSARDGAAAFVCYGKAYVGTGSGYTGKKESVWEYTPPLILGVDDYQVENVKLFPNPCRDYIMLEELGGTEFIALTDIQGKLIRTINVVGKNDYRLDCADLIPGVYFLNISGEKGEFVTHKVVVL